MTVIKVHLDKRSYPVVIGTNTLHRLGRLAKKQISQGRVFIIYDAQVFALYSESLKAVFDELGVDVIETNLPPRGKEPSPTGLSGGCMTS